MAVATSQSMKEVRLGMLGCGLISHAHGRAANKSRENIRFIACASRRLESAKAWASEYGCAAAYDDYRQMLEQETLDGLVIATWPAHHGEQVFTALRSGVVHILCEKALTTSGADALVIWREAQRLKATVMEGFMYRHHPVMGTLRRMLDDGVIGTIDSIRAVFHMHRPGNGTETKNWRNDRAAGGGVVHDFTCYAVNAANWLARSLPLRASAFCGFDDEHGIIDRLYGRIEYENGVIGLVESSHRSVISQALEINGASGRLWMPVAWTISGEAQLHITRSPAFLALDDQKITVPALSPHDGRLIDLPIFQRQLENFVDVIRGRDEPVIPLPESAVTALVLDALVASHDDGAPLDVRIPDDLRKAIRLATLD